MGYVFVGKGILLGKGGRQIKKGESVEQDDIDPKTAKLLHKRKLLVEGSPEDLQRRINELEAQVQKNREKAGDSESAGHKKASPGRPAKSKDGEE